MKRLFLLLLLTSLVACNRGETAKTSGGTSAPAPIGNAARDPAVKDDARSVAQAFAGAVDATIEEARSRLKKGD